MGVVTMFVFLWALVQGLTVLGVFNYLRHVPRDRQADNPGGTVVLLSVRDDWDGGAALIAGLRAQDSDDFRLLIATSGQCPAAYALALRYPGWVEVIAAGAADDEGQKIHKLRAALKGLRPEDRWLVFIDSDILPPARLVGRLLFPIVRGKAEIATGYRLLLPEAGRPLLALVGAVEMQLATLPRPANGTMPWGGAMAMGRDVAERIDLDVVLAGRLSDDLSIGLAARAAGLRMRPVRDLLVATPLDGGVGAALAFGVRQYRHVRTNSGKMWGVATLAVAVQAIGWIWALAAGGWVAIAIGYGAALGRCAGRCFIIGAVLEPDQKAAARRSLLWDAIAPFLVVWAHLGVQLAAALSSRIRWGGYEYRVRRGRVVAMRRVDQKPAGN
jgi:hypothetical protein